MDERHKPKDIHIDDLNSYERQDLEVKNKMLMAMRDILEELEDEG